MVSSAGIGVQTMNEQSGSKVSSQDDQNKAKPTKGELNEQDLNKVSGGTEIGGFNPTPIGGHDTNGVTSPYVYPTHTDPFNKG